MSRVVNWILAVILAANVAFVTWVIVVSVQSRAGAFGAVYILALGPLAVGTVFVVAVSAFRRLCLGRRGSPF